jgi:hypothetical protein
VPFFSNKKAVKVPPVCGFLTFLSAVLLECMKLDMLDARLPAS